MLENSIAGAMSGPIGSILADGRCSRGPEGAGFFVANIDCLRRRIQNRVVGPAGQAVSLAVAIPGKPGSGFTHHGAEIRVGNDIHPGCRSVDAGCEIDGIFAPVESKASQAVEIMQLHKGERGSWLTGDTFSHHHSG